MTAEERGPARMTGASTTREEVERQATDLCDPCATMVSRIHAAATLRALLDERDRLARMHATAFDAAVDAQAERDAARAEVERMREAWLRVIRAENSCTADGQCINAKRCGCIEEMEMLIREHAAALAGAPSHE
jgi:hypothetical protein